MKTIMLPGAKEICMQRNTWMKAWKRLIMWKNSYKWCKKDERYFIIYKHKKLQKCSQREKILNEIGKIQSNFDEINICTLYIDLEKEHDTGLVRVAECDKKNIWWK